MIATALPWTSRPQYLQRCAGGWWAIDLSLRTVRGRATSSDAPVEGRSTDGRPLLRRCVLAIWFRSLFRWVPLAIGLSVETYMAAMGRPLAMTAVADAPAGVSRPLLCVYPGIAAPIVAKVAKNM
jgi:hypothetical protein